LPRRPPRGSRPASRRPSTEIPRDALPMNQR
jgi:hypothetical protein